MKKIIFLILMFCVSIYANYKISFDVGPQLVYQSTYKIWSIGVSSPILFKFYETEHKVFTFLTSYGFNFIPASFDVKWFDVVSSATQTAQFDSKNYYHTIIFGPGFEYYFNVNWQREDIKYLKLFYPYIGTTFNFNFILIGRNYTKINGHLPEYLLNQYSNQTTVLPPTIGLSVYIGTKIKIKKYFFDFKTQYSALIPESKTKESFINHFFQFFIGVEIELPDKWFAVKIK